MMSESSATQFWRALTSIRENPFLVEVRWRVRRMMMGRPLATTQTIATKPLSPLWIIGGLVGLIFIFLFWGFFNRVTVPPSAACFPFMALVTLLSPLSIYQAIASERERRTWDFLLVSPRSNAEIVLGRAAGPVALLAILAVIAALFVVVLSILEALNPQAFPDRPLGNYFASLSLSTSLGLVLIGIGLVVTSVSKRALASLGISSFIAIVLVLVLPFSCSILFPELNPMDTVFYWNTWLGSFELLTGSDVAPRFPLYQLLLVAPMVAISIFLLLCFYASVILRRVDKKSSSS